MDTAGFGSRRGPYNCKKCNSQLKDMIIESNLDQSIPEDLECECKDKWKSEIEFSDITRSTTNLFAKNNNLYRSFNQNYFFYAILLDMNFNPNCFISKNNIMPMELNESMENKTSSNGLMEFLTELGKALTASGISVVDITSILEKIAIAYKTKAEILVFPTMILIKIGEQESAPLNAANQKPGLLPLNQVSEIYELIYKAETAEISPTEGKKCLRKILSEKHRFGPIGILIGYILFSMGIGMLLQPTPEQLVVSGVLGAIVGILLILSQGRN